MVTPSDEKSTVKKAAKQALQIRPIIQKGISFWIRGTSPMIQHAWTEKSLTMLRMTAQERKKQPKKEREPEAEGMACAYRTEDGNIGLPILAFKASVIGAAHKDLGVEKTLVRKAFFVPCRDKNGVVAMEVDESEGMRIREDVVRVGANQTDLRYRPEFWPWRCQIKAVIDTELLNEQDVVNLVNRAGFSIGIGEWRPEKGGEYGRFEVDTTQPLEEFDVNELSNAA